MSKECPCGSGQEAAKVCQPYISGETPAPTAEALMRSRYSAYVFKELDSLRDTLSPEAQEGHDEASVREWAESAEWLGLEIKDTWAGQPGDEAGIVEFAATYSVDGETVTHRERSEFRFDDGKWFYVDGHMVSGPPIKKERKVGRNEPCLCESGKKYKKCCGR